MSHVHLRQAARSPHFRAAVAGGACQQCGAEGVRCPFSVPFSPRLLSDLGSNPPSSAFQTLGMCVTTPCQEGHTQFSSTYRDLHRV